MSKSTESLLERALEEVAGVAVVLDRRLKIVSYTASASELVGVELAIGASAPKLICGSGSERPIAEALAAGNAASAEVMRPTADGRGRMIQVRATPLKDKMGERQGWILLLDSFECDAAGADDAVETWGVITREPSMRLLLRQVGKVARSRASVLIRGETGSGKELIAHAIHRASPRADKPFRAINCAALPPALLESELFGHVRGAFTGAVRDAPGHFRLAHGGTLFLDEVGDLPLEVQAKLLRVLQEGTVIPVGGSEQLSVDVRIVSATHRSLREASREHAFREDLMYRLRVVPLFIPPLRARPGDIEPLAWHFVNTLSGDETRQVQRITPGALARLEDCPWPGNVRQLKNAIEYALVMGEGLVLGEADLPPELSEGEEALAGAAPAVNTGQEPPRDLPEEARRILKALERAGGHQGRAAQSLGLSRVTLWRKIRKFGLLPTAEDGA